MFATFSIPYFLSDVVTLIRLYVRTTNVATSVFIHQEGDLTSALRTNAGATFVTAHWRRPHAYRDSVHGLWLSVARRFRALEKQIPTAVGDGVAFVVGFASLRVNVNERVLPEPKRRTDCQEHWQAQKFHFPPPLFLPMVAFVHLSSKRNGPTRLDAEGVLSGGAPVGGRHLPAPHAGDAVAGPEERDFSTGRRVRPTPLLSTRDALCASQSLQMVVCWYASGSNLRRIQWTCSCGCCEACECACGRACACTCTDLDARQSDFHSRVLECRQLGQRVQMPDCCTYSKPI